MANENKNTHELASESDEDTSELEILPETLAQDPDFDYEAESDAATHSFENLDRQRENDSLATLQAELRERHGQIGQLEYEVEQLRARCTVQQTELKAREEATGNLAAELSEAKKTLAGARERIERRDEKLARLEAEVRQQEERLAEAGQAIEESRERAETAQGARDELEQRWREACARITSLDDELARERAEHLRARDEEKAQSRRLSELEQRHGEARSLLDTLRQYIDGRRTQWEQQEVLLRTKDALLEEQHRKIRQYAKAAEEREARLRDEQEAVAELEAARSGLEKDNVRICAEMEALQGLLARSEPSLAAAREENAALADRLDEIERALGDERNARERAEECIAEREKQLRTLEAEFEAFRQAAGERYARAASREEELQALAARYEEEVRTIAAPLEQEVQAFAARLEDTTGKLAAEEAARRELQMVHDELDAELASFRAANQALERRVTENEELAAFRLAEIDGLATQLLELSTEHEKERNERQSLEAQQNGLEQQAARLRAEVADLKQSAHRASALEQERDRLSGLMLGQSEELRELRELMAKSEAYADSLRQKLGGQAAAVEASAAAQRNLQAGLDAAQARIEELVNALDSARRSHAELAAEREDDQRRFEEEVRKLRNDLTLAEETIAENQTLNEQLASDLLKTSNFRVTLESQLSEADETYQKQIKELNRTVKRLRREAEDYERKISSKDAAINVLLTELASKPQAPAAGAEDEPAVHRLPERKPSTHEDRPAGHEKERTTRLLIGALDGQEVRYPLFKNKLTIGRTAHNDIQLKAQYISRRHAVVVCDNDSTRVIDWGSKNGIYVNGTRVSEKILKNGDKVTVGTVEFRFEERPKR